VKKLQAAGVEVRTKDKPMEAFKKEFAKPGKTSNLRHFDVKMSCSEVNMLFDSRRSKAWGCEVPDLALRQERDSSLCVTCF
jgi:hypothetical protein